jgi:hypothetical protein
VLLVANKCDLEAQRAVSLAEAAQFAEKWMSLEPREVFSIEASALTGKNVDIAIKFLCEQILRNVLESESPVVLEIGQKKADKVCNLM